MRSKPAPSPRANLLIWLGVLAGLGAAAQWALVAFNWGSLPAEVPIHFNLWGDADATGGKWLLLLAPLLSTMFLLFLPLIRTRPDLLNIPWRLTSENKVQQVWLAQLFGTWMILLAVSLLTFLLWQMIRIAANQAPGLPASFGPIALAILLGSGASYLWQALKAR